MAIKTDSKISNYLKFCQNKAWLGICNNNNLRGFYSHGS